MLQYFSNLENGIGRYLIILVLNGIARIGSPDIPSCYRGSWGCVNCPLVCPLLGHPIQAFFFSTPLPHIPLSLYRADALDWLHGACGLNRDVFDSLCIAYRSQGCRSALAGHGGKCPVWLEGSVLLSPDRDSRSSKEKSFETSPITVLRLPDDGWPRTHVMVTSAILGMLRLMTFCVCDTFFCCCSFCFVVVIVVLLFFLPLSLSPKKSRGAWARWGDCLRGSLNVSIRGKNNSESERKEERLTASVILQALKKANDRRQVKGTEP